MCTCSFMAIYSDLFVWRFSWCISAWFFTDTLSRPDPQSLLLTSNVARHVVIHLLSHLTPVLLTTHSTLREGGRERERDYHIGFNMNHLIEVITFQ